MKLCQRPAGKCAWERRKSPPGDKSAQQRRRRVSDYGMQLQEKQKARAIYGVMERQFSNYYVEASRRSGVTGDTLLQLLEGRLDNVIFRMGFGSSRPMARQSVTHGHFMVNGRNVNIPSYQVRVGDKVEWRERSKKLGLFDIVKANVGSASTPTWLKVDADNMTGEVLALPRPQEAELSIDTRQIVEYYSRR